MSENSVGSPPNHSGEPWMHEVAQALSEVARSLDSQPGLQETVERLVVAVPRVVPNAEFAGVSLRENGTLRTVAASSEQVRQLNEAEHRLNEGPCVQAVLEHHTYRINDMSTDTRWPLFARAAYDLGMRSMLGYRLFTTTHTLGSLDLYSTQTDAFNSESELIGELFATHGAIALAGSAKESQWQSALRSRDIIATAKGILMQQNRITDDQAFAQLVSASQHANMKLVDVATWLVGETNDSVADHRRS